MEENDRLILEGTVVEANRGKFLVKINDNYNVLCTLGGRVRMNSVKILLGDRVSVEVGSYDTTMGRITFRHKA